MAMGVCGAGITWCRSRWMSSVSLFFFNDTATTEIYTLSLHDALPISRGETIVPIATERGSSAVAAPLLARPLGLSAARSEEHTSELQSQSNLVCRLLLEKHA